ncbi:Holliday junction DNA helicase RuvA [Wolbachia pipientis]|uniref:Holliday junction branch migration complex subunit RuvA n=1 Tax=Wolbachia pipientis TaxID=955 RepID=A0A1E7QJZ0_WOLPI|nr:Holliday junction branch migration protein RuvA [Wolbachia pipientis]OEY86773.1 Holliday junction DNA helicase RuvA [Wolbachia pipientis]
MIGTLSGTVDEIYNDHIILNVNGIGYIIYLSLQTLNFCIVGKKIKLFIETNSNSRENTIQLYGFIDKEEQQCLRLLIKISGISYKIAISVLSKLTPEQFYSAIANEDKILLKMSGLGTKLVNRLITELHGKISKVKTNHYLIHEDAVSALINLGYEKMKAYDTVKKIQDNLPSLETKDIIRIALKDLSTL